MTCMESEPGSKKQFSWTCTDKGNSFLTERNHLKAFGPDPAPAQISFLLALWWTTHMEIQASCAWFEFKLLLTLVENFHKLSSGFLLSPTTVDQFLICTWVFILSRSWHQCDRKPISPQKRLNSLCPFLWSSEACHAPSGAGGGWGGDGGQPNAGRRNGTGMMLSDNCWRSHISWQSYYWNNATWILSRAQARMHGLQLPCAKAILQEWAG